MSFGRRSLLQNEADAGPRQGSMDGVKLDSVIPNLFKDVNPYNNFAEEVPKDDSLAITT